MLELGPFVWDLAFCGGFRLEKKVLGHAGLRSTRNTTEFRGVIPTSSWSAFFGAYRENAIILVVSGNLSRFRKKVVSWNSALDPDPSPS
jgi:hypothetical protein